MMIDEDHWKAYHKENMLKCVKCNKPLVNAIDSKTGKLSKYIWKHDCNCIKNKNLRISLG